MKLKCKVIKKYVTITRITLAIVAGLLLLATLLLNTKPVQKYLLNQATHYLSNKIGSEVSISTVTYNLFTTFEFSDIQIKDKEVEWYFLSELDLNSIEMYDATAHCMHSLGYRD